MAAGRKGRGGGRGPLPRNVQVSKALSWLLRHGAEQEGLMMDDGGFVNVLDVLKTQRIRSLKVTFEDIREVVRDNDKQRFTMVPITTNTSPARATIVLETSPLEQALEQAIPLNDPKDYKIRANQGHSLKIESEGLLKPITADNMPPMAVHGTVHSAWPLIVQSGGLKPMGRNHVHFASGLPATFKYVGEGDSFGEWKSQPVISGMRGSSSVLIFVDLCKAMEAGIKFWLSDNGVILSEGNDSGIIPLDVLMRVEDRTGEGVLLEDGKVIREAPASWAKKGKGKG